MGAQVTTACYCTPAPWALGTGLVSGAGRICPGRKLGKEAAPGHGDLIPSPSLSSVAWDLVRKVNWKDPLVVHSNMEHDVALLRLYPGIPASLVGLPCSVPQGCQHAPTPARSPAGQLVQPPLGI